MNITLESKFHQSVRVTIRAYIQVNLTPAQVKKVSKALCGMSDCTCGGINDYPASTDGKFVLLHQDNGRGMTEYWIEER